MPARALPVGPVQSSAISGALLVVSPEERSVGLARSFVRDRLSAWAVPDDCVEAAALVVSELVTNAVQAGAGQQAIRVRCGIHGGSVRLEVSDEGPGQPVLRQAGEDEECGRGLALVAALSAAWGVDRLPSVDGKTVWAVLHD